MDKYELKVVGDSNDGDYITEINTVTKKELDEWLALFQKVIDKENEEKAKGNIHNYYNWRRNDDWEEMWELYPEFSESDWDLLNNYAPCGEYGVHSIVCVEYYPKPDKVVVYKGRYF